MKYFVTAEEIVAEARSLGAERVCFWTGEFVFSAPDADEVARILPNVLAGRYKHQRRLDGKWQDASRYRYMVDVALLRELEKLGRGVAPSFSDVELKIAASVYPTKFRGALRRILYDTLDRYLTKPSAHDLGWLVEYFNDFRNDWCDDEHFQFFITYLELLAEAFDLGLEALIRKPRAREVYTLVDELRSRRDTTPSAGSRMAFHCVAGLILSLVDRESAAAEFARLRDPEGAEMIRFFYWDSGALTYYGHHEIDGDMTAAASAVVGSILPIRAGSASSSTGIGISVDVNFLRIYGAGIVFYAQQMPEVDLNLFICADAGASEAVVADLDSVSAALSRLNYGGLPQNIRLFRMPTPEFVQNEVTFYACARFFAASQLLQEYQNVYLMDADLHWSENPSRFFAEIREVPFAVPETATSVKLAPWRRFMAGNVAMNRTVLKSTLLRDLQSYLVYGLKESADWMLDQNALSYVEERHRGGAFSSLNEFKRPFVGSRFMGTWEANFRRALKERQV